MSEKEGLEAFQRRLALIRQRHTQQPQLETELDETGMTVQEAEVIEETPTTQLANANAATKEQLHALVEELDLKGSEAMKSAWKKMLSHPHAKWIITIPLYPTPNATRFYNTRTGEPELLVISPVPWGGELVRAYIGYAPYGILTQAKMVNLEVSQVAIGSSGRVIVVVQSSEWHSREIQESNLFPIIHFSRDEIRALDMLYDHGYVGEKMVTRVTNSAQALEASKAARFDLMTGAYRISKDYLENTVINVGERKFKPKWWHIALIGVMAIFAVAIAYVALTGVR